MALGIQGWLPRQLQVKEGRALCRWAFVGTAPFTAPFFGDTLARCLSLPENSARHRVVTSLDLLPDLAEGLPSLAPAAFIFHVSRCGSTLLTQLLAEDPAFTVLSEVPFFDQLLRARFQPGLAGAAALLPAALKLHGQPRSGAERHLIVKCDSWHLHFHAELRALYPETPFILMHREPEAVIRSQRRSPGMHAIPGLIEPEALGLREEAVAELALDAYFPLVLAGYYRAMLAIARSDPRSLLVPYQADLAGTVEAAAAFAGLSLGPGHRERMAARALRHAKRPGEAFAEPEPEAVEAPLACREAYEALERFWRG